MNTGNSSEEMCRYVVSDLLIVCVVLMTSSLFTSFLLPLIQERVAFMNRSKGIDAFRTIQNVKDDEGKERKSAT
jgi:hypothetical protein